MVGLGANVDFPPWVLSQDLEPATKPSTNNVKTTLEKCPQGWDTCARGEVVEVEALHPGWGLPSGLGFGHPVALSSSIFPEGSSSCPGLAWKRGFGENCEELVMVGVSTCSGCIGAGKGWRSGTEKGRRGGCCKCTRTKKNVLPFLHSIMDA